MAYIGRILVRSPFFLSVTGTSLESVSLEVRIWDGDATTDRPTNPQYTIRKTPLQSGDETITFEISELVRDYFEHNRDAYVDTDTTFADCLWVETISTMVDSSGITTNTNTYDANDGYGYFSEGVNSEVQSADFTMVVLDGEDIRVPVQISDDYNNYIKFYDLNGTLRFDSGAISYGSDSQSGISYITQSQSTYTMSRADVGHTAGSVNYTITFVQADQCQQDASEVKFYDKDGALSILYMLGRKKESLNVRRDDYRKDLGGLVASAYTYSIEDHQQQVYNVGGNESIILNSGFIPESQNELFKQLLLSEFVWVDDAPVKLTKSNLEYKENKTDKLINYVVTFDKSNDVINNIY